MLEMRKDQVKWGKRAAYTIALLFIVWNLSGFMFGGLGTVFITVDGCECGLQREYIQFEHFPLKIIQRAKFNMKIISKGNEKHKHKMWDPQYKEIMGLFTYLSNE